MPNQTYSFLEKKYARMLKAGSLRSSILSIMHLDLALSLKDSTHTPMLERALDQIEAKQRGERRELDAALHHALDALAAGKYDRIEATDAEYAKIARRVDQVNGDGAQTTYVPTRAVVDLPTLALQSAELDSIVNDTWSEADTSTAGARRARMIQREAAEEQQRRIKELIAEQIARAAAEAPLDEEASPTNDQLVDLSELDDVAEPPVERELSGTARELLAQRMYVIDNVVSRDEAAELCAKLAFSDEEKRLNTEAKERALAQGRTVIRTSLRKRVIEVDVAKRVWSVLKDVLPHTLSDARTLHGVRSQMNFYTYEPGSSFKTHIDGGHRDPAAQSQSEFTFVLTLSDAVDGGSTRFCHNNVPSWDGPRQVESKLGRLLVFRQRDLKHCGALLRAGQKAILQGMVMFKDAPDGTPPPKSRFVTTPC